jgi:nucleoside-diphosphate-sugar epimerase
MDVFVVGATGELGRPTVARMVRDGHRVRGVARSDAKAALLRGLGADPVQVDVFDRDAMSAAMKGADAVVHIATHIPPVREIRKPGAWELNDKLRSELTPVLVDLALEHGAGAFVAESISFPYPDRGDAWIDESVPIDASYPSITDLERAVERFTAGGGRGVTLRFSQFYGPTAESIDAALKYAKWRLAMTVGSPSGYQSSIHPADAGSAVAAALDAPGGVYNVSDDEPLTRRENVDAFADAFGLARLWMLPSWLTKMVAGSASAALARSHRISNAKFKQATGWAPAYPNARQGWKATAAARIEPSRA